MYAQGPNALNLNSYANEEPEYSAYQEEKEEEKYDSQAIEEQFEEFVKDIQRYDEIISKVGKNVDDVSAEEYFITDFYPNFVFETTYEMDEEKRIIASTDPEMAKLMENLERGNRNLKEELKSWLFEYSKKTRLTEVLLTENKVLRKYASEKNKEIVKLIETIKNAENQELSDLKENLNQLKEENGVLLDHLKEIKQQTKDKADEEKKIIAAYEKAEKDRVEIEARIAQGEDEEEHYSKMVALLEDSINDGRRRDKKLKSEKERLQALRREYVSDEQMIEKEIEACEIDRQEIENQLKKKFKGHQSEKEKIMDNIEDITENIQKSKEETKDLQEDINKNESRIQDYIEICKDLDKKILDMAGVLETGKKELDEVLNTEVQYLSDIDMVDFEIAVLKEELKELSEKEEESEARFKRELKNLEEEKKNEITKWNMKLNKTQRDVSMRVLQEKSDLAVKRREVEDMERRVEEKKIEIADLRSQMKEIKQNQITVTSLREKLKAADRD